MRHTLSVALILSAAIVSSCSRRDSSMTGSYGNGMVAGKVIMTGDLAGTSAAGVEVSVTATGMSRTLGDDGRFSFVGIPERALLRFRRSDGINTQLTLAASSMVIELSTARVATSRRRPVSVKATPRAPQHESVFREALMADGIVSVVSSSSLVVHTQSKGGLAVNTDAGTTIRKHGQPITIAEINVDDEVTCRGTRVDDRTLLARQIEVRGK